MAAPSSGCGSSQRRSPAPDGGWRLQAAVACGSSQRWSPAPDGGWQLQAAVAAAPSGGGRWMDRLMHLLIAEYTFSSSLVVNRAQGVGDSPFVRSWRESLLPKPTKTTPYECRGNFVPFDKL
ncbi:unnamed protein product [Cuscuta epithymum]|uniref:Uncharacterized protein n=1 Tax=Cuscuta epithymum TaxID=186058 RepID=A0AAV0CUE4_9ASTE|nr:unnamed protein product [Cuscuta epithymum]